MRLGDNIYEFACTQPGLIEGDGCRMNLMQSHHMLQ